MFKKHVSTIVVAVLFILLIGYPKSVMAIDRANPIFTNEELFNIKASDTKWIEDEKIYSDPGQWELMEEYRPNTSYIIKSSIERYGGIEYDDIETVETTVISGSAVELFYKESCPTLEKVKQTMYDNYFSEYIGEPITVTDCSDKGYSQLYYSKGKSNQSGYFDSTQVFYGKAKGYFIAVTYTASMEKSDSVSEEWFTKMFYSWLDKIPSQEPPGLSAIRNLSYFKVKVIIAVSLIAIGGVAVGIILITQKSKKRKNKVNDSVPQVTKLTDGLQGIDNQVKFCTSCGYKTESDSKFCSKCGKQLD